jgi:hypothetical protein
MESKARAMPTLMSSEGYLLEWSSFMEAWTKRKLS